jgi:AraC-like DNA-binding protein
MVLHMPAGQAAPEHAHPEWTILLSLAGHITWRTGRCAERHAAGVVFPPHVSYGAASTAGHVVAFIEPCFQGLGPGGGSPVPLDVAAVEYLVGRWSTVGAADLDETARETATYLRRRSFVDPPVAIDPRVAAAIQNLQVTEDVAHAAARVGLSPSRLRALIHDLTGTSPARLRMWQRLRTAMLGLVDKPIAVAATDAGFADQAHLTRTATRLLGQTPGHLARMLRNNSSTQSRRPPYVRCQRDHGRNVRPTRHAGIAVDG